MNQHFGLNYTLQLDKEINLFYCPYEQRHNVDDNRFLYSKNPCFACLTEIAAKS